MDLNIMGMLAEIEQDSSSPLHVKRALRQIQAGTIDAGAKQYTHWLFGWIGEYTKILPTEEEKKILSRNPDRLRNEDNKKKLIRQQKKLNKRIASRNRTKAAKVTPELIEAVDQVLHTMTPARAADLLMYASAIVEHIRPQDMVELLEDCREVKIACSIPNSLEYVSHLAQLAPLFGVHYKLWTEFYWRTHSGFNLHEIHKISQEDIVKMHIEAESKHKSDLELRTCATRGWQNLVDYSPTLNTNWIGEFRNPELLSWIQLGAMDVPPSARLELPYEEAVSYTDVCFTKIEELHGEVETLEGLFDFLGDFANIEFVVPTAAIFYNQHFEEFDATVRTIVNKEELVKNANQMNNCTFTHYYDRYRKGNEVLWRIEYSGDSFNTAIAKDHNGLWRIRESEGIQRRNPPERVGAFNKFLLDKVNQGVVV